jgi:hypothetical protein
VDFPQIHHTNTGRPVEVDRTDDGALTFSDGAARLATLTPGGSDEWRLALPGGAARALHAAHDTPPISAVIFQIDLHEDEDEDTSGVED